MRYREHKLLNRNEKKIPILTVNNSRGQFHVFLFLFQMLIAENSTTVVYFTSLGMSMKAAVTFITVGGSTRNGSELSFFTQYIYQHSELLVLELLSTLINQLKLPSLWAVWAVPHALYIRFLRQTSQEGIKVAFVISSNI